RRARASPAAGRPPDRPSLFTLRGASGRSIAHPGNGPGGWVGWRPVEREEAEQVAELLLGELFLQLLGHQRQGADFHGLDLLARDDLHLAPLDLERNVPRTLLRDQSGEHAAVAGGHGRRLVGRADDQAGVEHVGKELLERRPAVLRDVGADVLALAVDLVAL